MGNRKTSEFTGKRRYWLVMVVCIFCGVLATVFGLDVFKTISYDYYKNIGRTIVFDVSSVIEETDHEDTERYLKKISEENPAIDGISVIKFSDGGKYVVHDTESEHIGSLEEWKENDEFLPKKKDILNGKENIVFISDVSDAMIPTITVMKKYDSTSDDALHSYVCARVHAEDILSKIIKNSVLVLVPVWALIVLMILFFLFDYRNAKRTEKEYEEIIRKEEEAIRGALTKAENADAANMAIFRTLSEATKESREAILSMSSSALMNIDDKDCTKACIERIRKAGEQLDSIIENIIDINGMETRKVSLKKIETSIPEIIHTLVDEAKDKLTAKDIKFDVITKNIVHEAVVADAVRLNNVFSSILDNAIKYTDTDGKIRVSVSERDCSIDGYASYEFKFSDTGIGMTNQYIEKIFEPFGEKEGETDIENKGFGLITAKNIIDVMNGDIKIESEKNVGTTVFVNVSLKISDAHSRSACNLSNVHALILDTDEADALAMSDLLKGCGAECEIFLGRRKAIDAAAKAMNGNNPFNAVFVDGSIIEKDDIDILDALKGVTAPDAKFVEMSHYKQILNNEKKEKGITDILRKPLFKSELSRVFEGR